MSCTPCMTVRQWVEFFSTPHARCRLYGRPPGPDRRQPAWYRWLSHLDGSQALENQRLPSGVTVSLAPKSGTHEGRSGCRRSAFEAAAWLKMDSSSSSRM